MYSCVLTAFTIKRISINQSTLMSPNWFVAQTHVHRQLILN